MIQTSAVLITINSSVSKIIASTVTYPYQVHSTTAGSATALQHFVVMYLIYITSR